MRGIHMARVKIEEIIDHLSSEMRKSLRDSVNKVIPEVTFDERELFRQFKREVSRKCSTWERVPDQYIDSE
jgi:division protein CdvB (Snf7/Vps24/ESCRT-III family)